jgi:replicative DNA helicase
VRNPVAKWLDAMGIYGLRSYEKYVPECVFRQPKDGIACFLRHLWATDGTSCITANRPIPTIRYATSSSRLAYSVQSLLLRIGINALITRVPQKEKGRDQYHIDVNGRIDQEMFISTIGMVGERKKNMLENVRLHLSAQVNKQQRDVLPKEIWSYIVVPFMQATGATTRQIQKSLGFAYPEDALHKLNLGRERAARLAQAIGCEQLAKLAQSDVYWDKIVSIEPDGETEVYDLTIDKLHNFSSSDIIIHNSLEQDSDIVMFIYRDDVYNPDSERKNIADIIVAKHRNGPVGEVSLFFQASQTRFRDLEVTSSAE